MRGRKVVASEWDRRDSLHQNKRCRWYVDSNWASYCACNQGTNQAIGKNEGYHVGQKSVCYINERLQLENKQKYKCKVGNECVEICKGYWNQNKGHNRHLKQETGLDQMVDANVALSS